MGNQLLIKSVGAALLTTVAFSAEITINDIDKLVNDIKEERIGLKQKEIVMAKDPFVYLHGKYVKPQHGKKTKKKRYHFSLTAIFNDRVKINNRWYKMNTTVKGYKITEIGENFVVLSRNDNQLRVFLKRPKSKKIKLLAK